jgi:hypothetical protein
VLRLAIGSPRTERRHVEATWRRIQQIANETSDAAES